MATTTTKTAEPEFEKLGENVYAAVVGDEIIIKIQKNHRHEVPDAEGKPRKTIRVASTLGNKELDGSEGGEHTNVTIGLNAYVYRQPK